MDQDSIMNPGFIKRKELFKLSQTAQFMSKIDADLFNQQNYLLNNIEVDIEITPHDSNFLLISSDPTINYELEIITCKLYVKHIELTDGLALDITRQLDLTPARYAYRKTEIKNIFISEGRLELAANLFSDQVPRRVVLGMVENEAYVGAQNKSPFNFKPFAVREIKLSSNGKTFPQIPYEFDFTKNKFVRGFHDMNESLGYAYTSDSNGISLNKYKSGWSFFIFNMTNSLEDDPVFDLIKSATTDIHIKFNQPIRAGGVTLIAIAELDCLLLLDKYRTITTDSSL